MIAQVVFNLPLNKAFDYLVPSDWPAPPKPGMRVMAPFGHRRLVGTVRGLKEKSRIPRLKSLLRIIDPVPVLAPESLELARWMSDYYGCSLGEAWSSMAPASLRFKVAGGAEALASARSLFAPESDAGELSEHGGQGRRRQDPLPLTLHQQKSFASIEDALNARKHQAFLLHGVTGSGKTELYLQAIAMAQAQGRGAIVLVPEIALTPQTIDRFRDRFGESVALWHSRLTARTRSLQWQRLASGRTRVVVGTRSAVFAPVASTGVIVLDEEHDPSYKQDQTPRYHARDVAMARARLAKAVVILGSATPSIESYYAARQGRLQLLELPERVQGRVLPRVEIVDMRREMSERHRRNSPFSTRLNLALRQTVDLKEQALLLLNRRGFARVAQCPSCGVAIRCTGCAVPLVYHASSKQLVCHYCNHRQGIPEVCPVCAKGVLRLRGLGTERIESELHRLFPASGIGRMDTDTTRSRESHRQLYEAIKTQQVDLMVGTQMLAKGLDLPQVTLVGVISADTALNLPDFRAGEWTFDLLTQVAGRAGRGERPGQVLIQTFCPQHYAIQAASRHDYQEFYRAEIAMRRRLKLPPLVHLIELTIQGSKAEKVQSAAYALKEAILKHRKDTRFSLLGPAPHRVVRLRKTIRWRLVLKTQAVIPAVCVLRTVLGSSRRMHGLPVIIDVDPL